MSEKPSKLNSYSLPSEKWWSKQVPTIPRHMIKDRRNDYYSTSNLDKQQKANNNEVVMDPWPNHTDAKLQSQKIVHHSKNGFDSKDCFGSLHTIYKPPLLQKMELDITVKKIKLKVPDTGCSKNRLMLYREAFSQFIEHCSFYKPILSSIKAEYDAYITDLEEKAREIVALREFNTFISLNAEKKYAKLGQKEQDIQMKNIALLKNQRSKITDLQNEVLERDLVVDDVTNKLAEMDKELRRAKEANMMLIRNITDLQLNIRELQQIESDSVTGPNAKHGIHDQTIQKITLEQSQRQVEVLMKRVQQLLEVNAYVVPRDTLEKMELKHSQEIASFKQISNQYQDLKDLNDRLFEKLERIEVHKNLYEFYFNVTYKTLMAKIDEVDRQTVMDDFLKEMSKIITDPEPANIREFLDKNKDIYDAIMMSKGIK